MDGRAVLQSFFLTGEKPTQGQFADLIESCFNLVDDTISIAMVSGLAAALAGKATAFAGTSVQYVKGDGTLATLGMGDITGALGFTPENVANKSTSTALGTSNIFYPSQNAVKTYVDTAIAGVSAGASPSWSSITGKPTTLSGYGITDALSAAAAAAGYQPIGSYLTGITSSLVTTALGYTPYNGATNPDGYLSGITNAMVTSALGYMPYNGATNPNGYLTGITSAQVTTAIGYTPYNGAANASGYLTSVTGSMVNAALGYVAYNGVGNPNGYLSSITGGMVNTALGYTAYNGATNPNGYISTITGIAAGGDLAGTYPNPTLLRSITPTWTGKHIFQGGLNTSGNINATANGSATTVGLAGDNISVASANYTDTSTAAGATVLWRGANVIQQPTFLASNTGVTYTTGASLFLYGPPIASGVTITNPYTLYLANGNAFFGGNNTTAGSFAVTNGSTGLAGIFSNGMNITGPVTTASLLFGAATSVQARSWFNGGGSATTLTSGNNYSQVIFGAAPIVVPGSGTIPVAANVVVNPIGAVTGAAAITETANLYIGAASTAGTSNYSTHIVGNARFDGLFNLGGTAGAAGQVPAVSGSSMAWITPFSNFGSNLTNTTSAGGVTVLTQGSTLYQNLTGVTNQTYQLPVTTMIPVGWTQNFYNNSTSTLLVTSSGGNTVMTLYAGQSGTVSCNTASGTTAASWSVMYVPVNSTGNISFAGNIITSGNITANAGTYNSLGTTSITVAGPAPLKIFNNLNTGYTGTPIVSYFTSYFTGYAGANPVGTYSNTSGVIYTAGVANIYNQASGSGGSSDWTMIRTETALGTGVHNFETFYGGTTGATLMWSVDRLGNAAGASVRGVAVTYANRPAMPVKGMLVEVTDSTVNTWGTTIAGGGSYSVLAHYNGTNWTVAAI